MRDGLSYCQHAIRLQDHGPGVSECVRNPVSHFGAYDQEWLVIDLDDRPKIRTEPMRYSQGFACACIGRHMTRMAPRDRHDICAAAVDSKMHWHFKRRVALTGDLSAGKVHLHEFGFRGNQAKRPARRDENSFRTGDAGADVTKALHNTEVMQYAAGGEYLVA